MGCAHSPALTSKRVLVCVRSRNGDSRTDHPRNPYMGNGLPGFPIDSGGAGGHRKNGFQRAMHKSTMHATKSSGRCENCKNATLHIQMDEPQSRRTLLSWLVGGGVAATLGSFLYPVIRFLNR